MSKTCTREKVLEQKQGRLADLREEMSTDEPMPDCLSIETFKEIKILLSWGGPSDGYKLKYSKDNELMSGKYFIADWFEYEETELTDAEAKEVADAYCIEPNL